LRHDRPRSGKEAAERLKKVARGKREARSPWIARKKLFSPERATECAEGANRSRSAIPRRRAVPAVASILTVALLVAQRLQWIDAHCAAGGEIAGQQGDDH
jgi:hypothetical protein